jgi:hypothetical protein
MSILYRRAGFLAVSLFFLIIFFGCSIKETVKTKSDEDILRDRIMTYWGYKVDQRFDKSYDFEYPVYKKEVSIVDYIKGFHSTMKWTKAEIMTVAKQDETAEVTLTVDTKVNMIMPKIPKPVEYDAKGLQLKERWVKIDDIWYHVPKR